MSTITERMQRLNMILSPATNEKRGCYFKESRTLWVWGSERFSGVMVWWERVVRQCDRCLVLWALWSVSTPLRAAEQKSSTIHHAVTLSLLIANKKDLSPAPVRPAGQWSVATSTQVLNTGVKQKDKIPWEGPCRRSTADARWPCKPASKQ